MDRVKRISPWQFACFRILFGGYLLVHFIQLLPYAGELFGDEGVLSDPKLNFTFGVLPNPLEYFGQPAFATGFVALLCLLALAFALGCFRRVTAVLLWYGWACLFNRDNLILNPGIPYVGLLLVLCAIIPPGEPFTLIRRKNWKPFQMPALIYWSAWFLLAAGYAYSGVYKLFSPSWTDGSALWHLLNNPLARPGIFRGCLMAMPPSVLKILTWTALAGEVLALPLSIHRRGRMIAWLWMMMMHLGILLVVDFADLTLGMVMIHLFTFDPEWLPARRPAGQTLFLFDGECGLCNRTVQFLLQEDHAETVRFAPLQGATACEILVRHRVSQPLLASAILVTGFNSPAEKIFVRSSAVLRSLACLGGFWRVVSWLQIVPAVIRDSIYDLVAKNRKRWFPMTNLICELPMPAVRDRLLA